jgi:hypothetical protein
MIDATHWEKLRAMDPRDVTARSLADYDAPSAEYRLRILTDEVRISPEKRAVAWPPGAEAGPSTGLRVGPSTALKATKPPGFNYWLVSVVYLLSAKALPPKGGWVSATSLPYGEFFFRGPHALATDAVATAFADRPEAFEQAAEALGGKPWPAAPCPEHSRRVCPEPRRRAGAFVLPALPRVPMLVQLWERDEEFPARASFLFDSTAGDQLMVDAIWSLSAIVAKRLVESAG